MILPAREYQNRIELQDTWLESVVELNVHLMSRGKKGKKKQLTTTAYLVSEAICIISIKAV
jgi:hypothetical protein